MSFAPFAIRNAESSDADALFGLLGELGYDELAFGDFAHAFERVALHPEMRVLIAEDETGRILGMISLSHRPQLRLGGTLVTIDELIVAPNARGSGVGRALLDHAREIARNLDARRIELSTNRTRESYARGFYAKNGFSEANSAVMRSSWEVLS